MPTTTSEADSPIVFQNRYTGAEEVEKVYGESFLRWTYATAPGQLALSVLVRRALFSRLYGWLMDRPKSRERIAPFIAQYGVPSEDAVLSPDEFATFNHFFARALKPEARPIAASDVVFPADGRHLGFADLSALDGIFVKGQRFDLPRLLGDAKLAEHYQRGTAVLSRLCPVDYHRFHFPVDGMPSVARQIPGFLYSVNPIALRRRIAILWENRRMITEIVSEKFGRVLMLEIGATCVGTICNTFSPNRPVVRGAEKGHFLFGGSSTLLLFEPDRIALASDLLAASKRGIELYARMGDAMQD